MIDIQTVTATGYGRGHLTKAIQTGRLIALVMAGLMLAFSAAAQERKAGDYPLTPDSLALADVAHGQLLGPFEFHSRIISGTVRRYWVYVPFRYSTAKARVDPPNLILFQDGQRFIDPKGTTRVINVLDNLIARGDIPPAIGVFVTPGNMSEHYPDSLGQDNPDHRAEEYDAINDTYATMVVDELLPVIAKSYIFSGDPRKRIIAGASSGAIAAFTVAWNRPEAFGNVVSFIGSYTSIGYHPATATTPLTVGGDTYPGLIRKNPIRQLRLFFQDGSNDLDNEHGDWFLANQQMVKSLQWANANADRPAAQRTGPVTQDQTARYDLKYTWGDGGHSGAHGGQLLPDILRWMWTR